MNNLIYKDHQIMLRPMTGPDKGIEGTVRRPPSGSVVGAQLFSIKILRDLPSKRGVKPKTRTYKRSSEMAFQLCQKWLDEHASALSAIDRTIAENRPAIDRV